MADTYDRDKLKNTTDTQGDFNLANLFNLEIDGVIVGGIHSIEGFESETEVVEYKDGTTNVVKTRPGQHKPVTITITKDWSNTSEFYKWRKACLDGKVERKSVSIIFNNDANAEAGRINLFNAWPVSWTGPSLNARNSGHATEKLKISAEMFELKAKG